MASVDDFRAILSVSTGFLVMGLNFWSKHDRKTSQKSFSSSLNDLSARHGFNARLTLAPAVLTLLGSIAEQFSSLTFCCHTIILVEELNFWSKHDRETSQKSFWSSLRDLSAQHGFNALLPLTPTVLTALRTIAEYVYFAVGPFAWGGGGVALLGEGGKINFDPSHRNPPTLLAIKKLPLPWVPHFYTLLVSRLFQNKKRSAHFCNRGRKLWIFGLGQKVVKLREW